MHIESIGQVGLAAPDLDASANFYSNILGARLVARFDPPGLVFLAVGDVRLLLERNAAPATVYYRVNNLEAVCAELASQGVVAEQGPHMIYNDEQGLFGPAGQAEWMAFIRDPGNNLVGLMERRPSP